VSLTNLLARVMNQPELKERPPVLADVGASGGTHSAWKLLAPYAVCIAFDPDRRELSATQDEASLYKELHVVPAAAVPDDVSQAELFLTRSPYCSSLLEPRSDALQCWSFSSLFEVVGKAAVPCESIPHALTRLGITYIDWFKTDSQGVDLRLYRSLPESFRDRILAVEFEPGLIDAYHGEDKLHAVLAEMDRPDYWLARFELRGTVRLPRSRLADLGRVDRWLLQESGPISPGWGELLFLHSLTDWKKASSREALLGWVIATLCGQHAFALDLARRTQQNFGLSLANELGEYSLQQLRFVAARRRPVRVARGLPRLIRSAGLG
jgi:FkbM family methyltransferase